jgi:hypothetical protein
MWWLHCTCGRRGTKWRSGGGGCISSSAGLEYHVEVGWIRLAEKGMGQMG